MQREMDLIRALLLKIEDLPWDGGSVYHLTGSSDEVQIDGYSQDQIDYHLVLIEEAGLIESIGSGPMEGGILFSRLSWAGHDFVDAVRSPEIWAKAKRGAESAGGFTLDLLKDLAKGFIKKQIEDLTGVKF